MSEAFQPGFGAQLKAGREAKGLSVADVAAKLKLTARQVEALEVEDMSHLPSPVFVRGFVRNYARLVDVDADSLIAPVDVETTVAETITAPSAGVAFAGNGLRQWVLYPMIAFGLFILLVAILYHWLRQGEAALVTNPAAEVQAPAGEVVMPAAPPPAAGAETSQALPLSPTPQILPDGTPPAAPAPAAPPAAPAGPAAVDPPAPAAPAMKAPAQPPVPAALPAAPKPAAQPAPNANPAGLPPAVAATSPVQDKPAKPAKPSGTHALRFEPAQDAWIQVVDGKGSRFSKLVRAGSAESFSGELPFRLVVGEAAKVRMSYDGHVIDLTPFIGQKVARLTLE